MGFQSHPFQGGRRWKDVSGGFSGIARHASGNRAKGRKREKEHHAQSGSRFLSSAFLRFAAERIPAASLAFPFSWPKLRLSPAPGRRSALAVPGVEAAERGLEETFPHAPRDLIRPARVSSRPGQRGIRHNANGIRANAVRKRARECSPRAFANRNGPRQFWTCNAKSDSAGARQLTHGGGSDCTGFAGGRQCVGGATEK